MFNAVEDLYKIMHRESFPRCYEKVKNIVRKNAKKNTKTEKKGGGGDQEATPSYILETNSGGGSPMTPPRD